MKLESCYLVCPSANLLLLITASLSLACGPKPAANSPKNQNTSQQTQAQQPQVGELQTNIPNGYHLHRHKREAKKVLDFAPKIVHQPQSFLVQANKPHTIECAVESKPEAEVKWFKDGQLLASQPPHLEQTGGELMFFQMNDEDTGDYHCQATNYLGSTTSDKFRLTVQSSVHDPRIRFEPRLAEVGADQQVEFTCTLPRQKQQKQAPEVSWKRNGRRLIVKWLDEGEEPSEARSRFVARQAPPTSGSSENLQFVLTITRTLLKDDNSTFTCLYKKDTSAIDSEQGGADEEEAPEVPVLDQQTDLAHESSLVRLRVYEQQLATPDGSSASYNPQDANNNSNNNNNNNDHVKLDVNLAPPINNLDLANNNPREINAIAGSSSSNQRQRHNQTTQLMDPTKQQPNNKSSSLRDTILDLFELVKPALVVLGLLSIIGLLILAQLVFLRRRNRMGQNRYMKHHQYVTNSASGSSGTGSSASGTSGTSALGCGTGLDCDPVLSSLMARTLSAPSASSLQGAGKKFRSYRDHMRKVSALASGNAEPSDLVDAAQYFGMAHEREPFFGGGGGSSANGNPLPPPPPIGGPNLYNQSLAAREQARSLLQAADHHMRSLSNLNCGSNNNQKQLAGGGQHPGLRLSQNGSHLNLPLSFAFGAGNGHNQALDTNDDSQLMEHALWPPHLKQFGWCLRNQQHGNGNNNNNSNLQHQQPTNQNVANLRPAQQPDEHYQLVNCSSISPSSTSSTTATSQHSQTSGNGPHRASNLAELAIETGVQQQPQQSRRQPVESSSSNHYSIIETNDEEDRYEELDSHQQQHQHQANSNNSNTNMRGMRLNSSSSQDTFRASTFLPADHNSGNNNSNNNTNLKEGINQKSSLRSSLISNSSTSGCGDSNTTASLVSSTFNRSISGSSRQQPSGKHLKANKRNVHGLNDSIQQDQLSPYAVSSICGSLAQPPPVNSEAMRALNEQFDISQLMMLSDDDSDRAIKGNKQHNNNQQPLPFDAPPPPQTPAQLTVGSLAQDTGTQVD